MNRPAPRYALALVALLSIGATAPSADTGTRYPPVLPGTPLVFPRDHGAHPDYRVEWWYLTGWLDEGVEAETSHGEALRSPPKGGSSQSSHRDSLQSPPKGDSHRSSRGDSLRSHLAEKTAPRRPLGFQLTFFRLRPGVQEGNASAFAPTQLLFAHAALADPAQGRLRHAEKSARAGFGLAFAETTDTRVAIDAWSLRREGAPGAERYLARAEGEGFAFTLVAAASAPPLLQGEDARHPGYSRKGAAPHHASHYYSRPQLAVHGSVERDGRTVAVRGRAWLDHEWSSEAMPEGAVGWDWLGANLDDGSALMAFRLRDSSGNPLWAGGTLGEPGRPTRRFGRHEVSFTPLRRWTSPRTGGDYAVEMEVLAGGRRWRLVPLLDDQEVDARGSVGAVYWEGAVRVLDEGGAEAGRGYLEITGVVGRLRM